jgi:hypothetical protein
MTTGGTQGCRAGHVVGPIQRRQQHNNQIDNGSGDNGGSIEGDSGNNDDKDAIAIISNI